MRRHESEAPSHAAVFRALAAACFVMQAAGCAHEAAERPAPPQKSRAGEKPSAPAAPQAPRAEQTDKSKTAEKKPAVSREKKPAASADRPSGRKPEQAEESSADTFAPPPPLRPPTFGGAGG